MGLVEKSAQQRAGQAPMLNCRIVSDCAGFQALENDWNRLADLTDASSVFLRHEWSDASWQWLNKESCQLCILCVERDAELVGILPLVRHRAVRSGLPVSELKGLAVPDTQEFSLIAHPAHVHDVAAAVMRFLQSGPLEWDVLSIDKLPEDLAATELLADLAAASGLGGHFVSVEDNPGIRLDDGWASYYGRRSRRLKKGNNLVRNRLERDGKTVEIRCIDYPIEGSELTELLDTLAQLSASSWKASTGLTLNNPGPSAFLSRLSQHAVRNGWLLVWLLTIDDVPAAMEYQLEYNGTISGLRADYDDRFGDYSPGTLLNWRIIERLFDRDAGYYALGPGSNPYKSRWVEESRELREVVFYSTTIRARWLRLLETFIRPLARRVFRK